MRPYIICHMATSIDGRLHPSRFTTAASGTSSEVLAQSHQRYMRLQTVVPPRKLHKVSFVAPQLDDARAAVVVHELYASCFEGCNNGGDVVLHAFDSAIACLHPPQGWRRDIRDLGKLHLPDAN